METESLSVYQLGTDKSVLVNRVSDELCVIVANTKEMQKYIQFTPNTSVFCNSSLFRVANYIYSISLRNCVNLSHQLNLVILSMVYVLFKTIKSVSYTHLTLPTIYSV